MSSVEIVFHDYIKRDVVTNKRLTFMNLKK